MVQAAQDGNRSPAQLLNRHGELKLWIAFDQCVDRNLPFEPGKRRAQTVMDALAKTKVAIGLTRNVKLIRL